MKIFLLFLVSFTLILQGYSQQNNEPIQIDFSIREYVKNQALSNSTPSLNGKIDAYFHKIDKDFIDRLSQSILNNHNIPKNRELNIDDFKNALNYFALEILNSKDFELFNAVTKHTEKYDTVSYDGKDFVMKALNEPCNNADFETGDFTGWELSKGTVTNQPYGYNNVSPIAPNTQHFIVNGGFDPNVPNNVLPKLNPEGGTYSVQLGDLANGSNCALMRQTFLVDQNSTSYSYSYAIVMQDPSDHSLGEKPFFRVNMFDENNNPLTCGEYKVISGAGGDPGFIQFGSECSTIPFFNITTCEDAYYLPWRTTFIPLDAYVGQNITIEFVVGDCSQSGHWGYAYLDASCSAISIDQTAAALCSGDPIVLTAPEGAQSYLWTPGNQTSNSITVTDPGTYTVTVTPVSGSGCSIDLTTVITGSTDHPVADFTVQPTNICVGSTVTVTDQSTVVGTSSITGWEWDFDGDGIVDATEQNPGTHTYDTPGNYGLTLTASANGCTDSKTINIQVDNGPDGSWNPPDSICPNSGPINLNSLLTGQAGGTWSGTGVSGNMFDPVAGSQAVTYTINSSTCNVEVTHTIPVLEAIQVSFTLPNEICLEANPIALDATPAGGVFTIDNQPITEFKPSDFGVGNHYITYTVGSPSNASCTYSSIASIKVVNGLTITSNIPDKFCYHDDNFAVTFTPAGGDAAGSIISGTTLNIANADAGNYTVDYHYVSPEGCSSDYSKSFTIFPEVTIDFESEQACYQTVTLTADNDKFKSYYWSKDGVDLGQGSILIDQIRPAGEYTISLLAINANGCKANASKVITVTPSDDFLNIQIPNVITPNGDGANDIITMPLMDDDCIEYKVIILNRWGQKVYTCDRDNPIFSGKTQGGAALEAGVYFYKIESKDFDCNKDPYKPRCHGFITIVK